MSETWTPSKNTFNNLPFKVFYRSNDEIGVPGRGIIVFIKHHINAELIQTHVMRTQEYNSDLLSFKLEDNIIITG